MGQFSPDSSMGGQQVQRALAPLSDEEMERQLIAYENFKMAERARMEESRPGTLGGIARGALQGLTFGFGDEIVARVRSLGPRTYSEAVQGERDALAIFREEHPVLAIGSELAGGLIVPIGGAIRGGAQAARLAASARATAKANSLVRLGRGAAQGALYGGLYGAGSAEGGLAERLEGGIKAAPLGAGLGVAIPVVASGVGQVLRKTGVSQAFGRVSSQAKNYVLRAVRESGMSPQQLRDRIVQSTDKPEILADLIGESGQRLAEGANVFNTPNAAKLGRFVEGRMASQSERIISGVRGAAKLPPEDVTKTVEQLIGERAARAKPLYESAYQYGDLTHPQLTGQGLKQMLATPGMTRAYKEAQALAAEEGVSLPALGEVERITVQTADYLKRALDDVLYVSRRSALESGGLGPGRIRALKHQRAKLLAAVDEEVPVYAEARASFEGPTKLVEALEDGQQLWRRMDLDTAMAEFGRLSPSEQELFRRGAIDGLRARLDEIGDSRDKLRGFFDSPADRRRLRIAIGDAKAANGFKEELEREVTMAETRNLVRANSATARRTEAAAEISGLGLKAIVSAVAHPFQTTANALDRAGTFVSRGRPRANEISRLLAAGEGGRNQLLQVLDELIAAEQANAQRTINVRNYQSRIAGQIAGRE
jgi:hypothetical protein